VINNLHPGFKTKFRTKDDLIIPSVDLKMILREYRNFEGMIKERENLMVESFPMKHALNEFNMTKDVLISQVLDEHKIKLTPEQQLQVTDEFQKKLESGDYFEELRNTLYTMLLLGYVVIMHANLEKHQSSARYDLEREKKYSKDSELIQVLPLMHKVMKKMIEVWYYLIRINNPDIV